MPGGERWVEGSSVERVEREHEKLLSENSEKRKTSLSLRLSPLSYLQPRRARHPRRAALVADGMAQGVGPGEEGKQAHGCNEGSRVAHVTKKSVDAIPVVVLNR